MCIKESRYFFVLLYTLTVAMVTPSGGVAGGIQYSCIFNNYS